MKNRYMFFDPAIRKLRTCTGGWGFLKISVLSHVYLTFPCPQKSERWKVAPGGEADFLSSAGHRNVKNENYSQGFT